MLVVKNIIFVFRKYVWRKSSNARLTHELLTRYIPSSDWHFMNAGYRPDAKEAECNTSPFHVKEQRSSANMYHYLACKIHLTGKKVLEAGSGRGGGAAYIARNFHRVWYTGLDIAEHAVDLSRKIHDLPNLSFVHGSGESLVILDNSIDVVIAVESSHEFGNVKKFLSEVIRALKPGGHLLLADFRESGEDMEVFWQELMDAGLLMVSKEDITTNVVAAIESDDHSKRKKIESLVPGRYQKMFCDLAAVVGSKVHRSLKDGSGRYYRFVLRKPEAV